VIRFPVVLFDLDGTVVDSGAIILASMRHATREVLGREYGDEELLASVGGPGLEAQMAAFAPDRIDELVRVYRAHNEPLHDELEACAGMADVLVRLKEEGRRLGIVTAKRRSTVELAFAQVPLAHLFETVVGGDETERHKPDPEPLLLAAERMSADPAATAYVGDSPYDIRAAKAAGMHAIGVSWGRIHDRASLEAEKPDAVVDSAEELLEHL
jgi:pyrophosphatase PpaX